MNDDDLHGLDRELAELGAAWRAENPPDVDLGRLDFRRAPRAWVRWAGGAGAAAAAVAAVVAGATVLVPDDPPVAGSPDAGVVRRLDCVRPAERAVQGAPAVPDGAVAARICGRVVLPDVYDAVWPVDTLTGAEAEELVRGLNALGSPGNDRGPCVGVGTYALTFRYPSGERVWVDATGPGCGDLQVQGGGRFGGAGSVRALARRLITEQRANGDGPGAPVAPVCPVHWNRVAGTLGAPAVTPGSEVAVTACQYRLESTAYGADGRLDLQAVVKDPADLVTAALGGSTDDPCIGEGARQVVQRILLVRNGYGDIQVVPTDPCASNELGGAVRYPTAAFAAQVAELFGDRVRGSAG